MTATNRWHEAWTAPGERLIVEARNEGDWTRHRTRSNSEGDGAVAVVTDGARVLFINADRPAIDRTLWELPRGQADYADDSAAATAVRELHEETGLVALESRFIGQVWPDSGLSADAVNVVMIQVDTSLERAPAEYSQQQWIAVEELGRKIASGLIADGISLAALALVWSHGEFAHRAARA